MKMKRAMSMLSGVLISVAVQAADRTWDGGGSDANWSTVNNWDGNATAPSAGDTLIFGGAAWISNNNDLSAGTAFSGITFTNGVGAFVLNGNTITLNGNISNLSTSAKTINLPMVLSNDRTIFGSNAAFAVNGLLSGPGGLNTCVTNNTVTLSGNNTYEGFTTVSNGTLQITHSSALGSANSGTRVFCGTDATLKLSGNIEISEPLFFSGAKPQAIFYNSSLISDVGSNTVSGLISKEGTLRIRTESGAKTLVLSGGLLHVSGSTLGFNPQPGSTIIIRNKPLLLGSGIGIQSEYGGTVVIAVPGNTYASLLIVSQHKVRTDVANALCPTATLTVGGSWSPDALLDMNGFDQTTASLRTEGLKTNPGYLAVTSAAPATLTVNQGDNTVYAGALAGAVRLIKNNGGTLTFSNVTSTTTGDITVNAGTLAVAENGGFGASATFWVNGGTLELRNGTALPDTATVRLLEGAKFKIMTGVTETIDKLFLDGEQQASGTWGATGSGATFVNDAYLSGGGVVNVTSGPVIPYADAVWDGGGADVNISTANNWTNDVLPSFGGTARAIFASGGATATVDTAVSFVRMTFNANTNFTLAAGAGVITNGAGGLKACVPTAVSRTYTLAEDVVLDQHQYWSITNNGAGGTTLNVTGALADGDGAYDLTKRGNGVLALSGNNSFDGKFSTGTTGCVVIAHNSALGSTNGATEIQAGSYMRIDGGSGITVAEALTMAGDAIIGYAGTLRNNTGSNTWSGKITANGARIRCEAGTTLEITGGVDGTGFTGAPVSGGTLRFSQKPVTAASLDCNCPGGNVILSVGNNQFTSLLSGGGYLRVDVPNAWPATVAFTVGTAWAPGSVNDLNGNSQTVGTLMTGESSANKRIIYSVAPATLTVNQSGNSEYNGSFTGAVSLVKLGTGNLLLTGTNTTFGGFSVSNGVLGVGATGTLGNSSTNIVVDSTGTLLLSNAVAIANSATVRMPPVGTTTAKINLAAGVNEAVGWLYFGDKMQRAGTYGSTSSTAATKDAAHFAGTGVLTVLHDKSGSLLRVQ
jgi:autotransporter-associated beta strand protein